METASKGAASKPRVWKKLDRAIYAVGELKVVYFRIMVNGRREMMKAPIQGAAAIGPNGRPTNELKKACLAWRYALMNKDYYDQQESRKTKVPSFAKLIELYEDAASAEQLKSGSPEPRTVDSAMRYFRYLVAGCGYDLSEPCSKLKTSDIDAYVVKTIKAGATPTTALSYATSCKSVTARWALPYYANEGYEVAPYVMPVVKNRKPPRYERPSQATLDAVEAWYQGLWKGEGMTARDCKVWFFVTMMLRFGVRNGDVGRITMQNFVTKDGSTRLCYTPHKTASRSGTRVSWPLKPDLFDRIGKVREILGIDEDVAFIYSPRSTSILVNDEMRRLFPELADREKASYELRKMCVDKIYHLFGVEMAAAISGDDIKTLTYFYADTAHVEASDALIACQ